MAIQFLDGKDRIVSTYAVMPNMSKRAGGKNKGFYSNEKKYVNTETNAEVLNTSFDSEAQFRSDLITTGVLTIRESLWKILLRFQQISVRNKDGALLNDAQRSTIIKLVQYWEDITIEGVSSEGLVLYNGMPVCPDFLPDSWVKEYNLAIGKTE